MSTLLKKLCSFLSFCSEPATVKPTDKVVAVCVGHSRRNDNGAVNTDGASEYKYNALVGVVVAEQLRRMGHTPHLIAEYGGNSYGSAMTWVAAKVKELKADVAVELHFNSAVSKKATGHEWLYWLTSRKGKLLAESFQRSFVEAFPDRVDRGLKAKDQNSRGAGFLSKTHCPAIICEPFFGSNEEETEYFSRRVDQLGVSYASAIDRFLR
jgi:N-acetylmuramoyl-L-alanine amidase